MDFQTGFNVVMGIVGVVVMPTITMLLARIKDAELAAKIATSDLQIYKTYIAENYTSLRRFEGFETALFKKLDTIEEKLDMKVDK